MPNFSHLATLALGAFLASCSGGGGGGSAPAPGQQPAAGNLAAIAGRTYLYGQGSIGEMSLRVAPYSADGFRLDAWVDMADGRTFNARIFEDMDPPSNPFTATDIEAVFILDITINATWAWSWLAMRAGGERLDYGLEALGGWSIIPPAPAGYPQNHYTNTSFWQ